MASSNLDLVRRLFGNAFSISRWYIPGHDGIDLPAKTGTPIRAVASGVVTYARDARVDPNAGRNWAIGGGRTVNIDIGGEMTTQYAHLDTIYVKAGQHVRKGDIIGTVGSTGGMPNSPGASFGASSAHLHFGLWNRRINKMVDPTAFLTAAAAGWDDSATVRDQWYKEADTWGVPQGTKLTAAHVETIIRNMDKAGLFRAPEGTPPILAQIAEAQAIETFRKILSRYIGQPWDPTTMVGVQDLTGAAAAEAGSGIAQAQAITGAIASLSDPGNWVRILALFGGAIIFGIGAYGVLRATGPSIPTVRPY